MAVEPTPDRSAAPDMRIRSVTIHQTRVIRATTALTLEPAITVLVGRNGAGKSALLEALVGCFRTASRGLTDPFQSVSFEMDADLPEPLMYRLMIGLVPGGERGLLVNADEMLARAGEPKPLWSMRQGVVFEGGVQRFAVPVGSTVVSVSSVPGSNAPASAHELFKLFASVTAVWSGLPRGSGLERPPAMVEWSESRGAVAATGMGPLHERVVSIAARLVEWSKRDPTRFDAFREVLHRVLGIVEMEFKTLRMGRDPQNPNALREFNATLLDDEDIGELADGTLRALEILTALHGDSTVLLIEEPELGIHPGLVSKLLAEIESASSEKQIVVTTHSPQVVSRFPASSLRLVSRIDKRFEVRPLEGVQLEQVQRFLDEEGTLGEIVFQGPLED